MSAPCAFCGRELDAGRATFDGRLSCGSHACREAEDRARLRAAPPMRKARINYQDRWRRRRSYVVMEPTEPK